MIWLTDGRFLMAKLSFKVKRRDSAGKMAEVECDTIEDARKNRKNFHDQGYSDVWIEDADGVMVDPPPRPNR
jgi:hypothetical protein